MRQVTILGATGSVGINALDVIQQHPDQFTVYALAAHSNVERLAAQCQVYRPRFAVLKEPRAAAQLKDLLQQKVPDTEVLVGDEGLELVASAAEVDVVVAAIVGAAGLRSTVSAVQAGKTLLLANKEALVMGGAWLMSLARRHRATLLPIDSEHNAIFQCLPSPDNADRLAGVKRLWLTASGGPFRDYSAEQLRTVTPAQACAHPVWSMGQKISVDSATMMNKGLELIEACWLFDVPADQVTIVVHPNGVLHSMVEYDDGSILSQMGSADMRIPIAHALAWPERITSGADPLELFGLQLSFERPKPALFPCLTLAQQAFVVGGSAPVVLNASNEVAVASFLSGRIGFMDIPGVIEETLSECGAAGLSFSGNPEGIAESIEADGFIENILAEDAAARRVAEGVVDTRSAAFLNGGLKIK